MKAINRSEVFTGERSPNGTVNGNGNSSAAGPSLAQGSSDAQRFQTLVFMVLSLAFSIWFTQTQFVPEIPYADLFVGHDGLRYHVFAEQNASTSLSDIAGAADAHAFEQSGYAMLLALLYGLSVPDPMVGCVANWLLWAGAGFMLSGLVGNEPVSSSRHVFRSLWILYPESICWNAQLLKETLAVFVLTCAIRVACLRISYWAQSVAIIALALFMSKIRMVAVPLVLLPWGISFEFRGASLRENAPRVAMLGILAVLALYVASGDELLGSDADTPLTVAGFANTEGTFASNLSSQSVLRMMGSPNRFIDTLYIPIRSLANVMYPLYLPFERNQTVEDWLQWASALVCFVGMVVMALRQIDRKLWTKSEAVLWGTFAVGFVALGLSGIIHVRYRSLVIPALIPLVAEAIQRELASHGSRRLLLSVAGLPILIVSYRAMRGF
jgi:hypothetical protein